MPPLMRKELGRERSGSGDASDGRPSAYDRNVCTFRYLFPPVAEAATLPTDVPRATIGSLARYSTTATLSRVSTSAGTAGKVTSPVAAHSTPRLRVS